MPGRCRQGAMLVSVTLPVEHKPLVFYSRPTVVSVAWTCFQVSVLVDILTRGYPGLPHQFEESETSSKPVRKEMSMGGHRCGKYPSGSKHVNGAEK